MQHTSTMLATSHDNTCNILRQCLQHHTTTLATYFGNACNITQQYLQHHNATVVTYRTERARRAGRPGESRRRRRRQEQPGQGQDRAGEARGKQEEAAAQGRAGPGRGGQGKAVGAAAPGAVGAAAATGPGVRSGWLRRPGHGGLWTPVRSPAHEAVDGLRLGRPADHSGSRQLPLPPSPVSLCVHVRISEACTHTGERMGGWRDKR